MFRKQLRPSSESGTHAGIKTRRASALVCGIALMTSSAPLAFSQTTQQSPNTPKTMNQTTEDFRRQAPQPLAARPLSIPTPKEVTLSNGLRVVMLENAGLPLVSFRLAFRTGTAYDPKDIPGLTSMVAELLQEGTTTRSSQQIAEQVARLGATLSTDASSDYTVVAASALTSYTDEILDLMADVALRPSFPESEVTLAKQNTKQGLQFQRSQASFLANERISKVLYGDNPYSVVTPTEASLEAMTRDKLIAFYRSIFVPNNAVMVIAGDFKANDMQRRIENLFGEAKWKRGTALTADFPAPPVRDAAKIYLVDRPGSAQSNIAIGNVALKRTDPDYYPVLLMHSILGGSASARLFMNLREDKGYTYGAYSSLDTRRDAGTLRATAEVRSDVTGAALKEFFYELNRIRTEPVTDKDLADAKAYLSGVFPIRLETQEGMIGQLVQIKMYDLPANYLQTYRDEVQKVTKADVQRVARKYLTPDKAAIVIVGDAAKITDQIKPYAASIEVYNADGTRKEANASSPATATNGNSGGDASAVAGSWTLSITAPNGQQFPATLTLNANGNALNGSIESALGGGQLSDVKVEAGKLTANLSLAAQGQQLNANISGRINAGEMTGELALPMPGAPPLTFTGTKTK